MTVSFVNNLDINAIRAAIPKKQKKALEDQLVNEVRQIIKRTQGGTDADGGAFKPYSPQYARVKYHGHLRGGFTKSQKKQGTFGQVVGAYSNFGNVDLTLSGAMLRSIQSKVVQTGNNLIGTIFIPSGLQALKAQGNMRYRKFFAWSQEAINRLNKAMKGVYP